MMSGRQLCFSLVDYMFSFSQAKFVEFIDRLKAGTEQDQAIQQVFGMSATGFEKGWSTYVRKKY